MAKNTTSVPVFHGGLLEKIFQIGLALLVSYLLFMIIPVAQELLKSDLGDKKFKAQVQQMEIQLQAKPEPKKQVQQQMRKMSSSQEGKANSGRSLSFKFSPDLGVGDGSGVGIATSNLQNMVFEEGQTDEPAVPLSQAIPEIPSRARDMGIGGTAELYIVIDRSGKVSRIEYVKIPHPVYKAAIESTLRRWRFKPAKQKGIPVQLRVRQVIEFRLE